MSSQAKWYSTGTSSHQGQLNFGRLSKVCSCKVWQKTPKRKHGTIKDHIWETDGLFPLSSSVFHWNIKNTSLFVWHLVIWIRCLEVSSGASEKGGPTVDTANLNNPHPPHGVMLSLGVFFNEITWMKVETCCNLLLLEHFFGVGFYMSLFVRTGSVFRSFWWYFPGYAGRGLLIHGWEMMILLYFHMLSYFCRVQCGITSDKKLKHHMNMCCCIKRQFHSVVESIEKTWKAQSVESKA